MTIARARVHNPSGRRNPAPANARQLSLKEMVAEGRAKHLGIQASRPGETPASFRQRAHRFFERQADAAKRIAIYLKARRTVNQWANEVAKDTGKPPTLARTKAAVREVAPEATAAAVEAVARDAQGHRAAHDGNTA